MLIEIELSKVYKQEYGVPIVFKKEKIFLIKTAFQVSGSLMVTLENETFYCSAYSNSCTHMGCALVVGNDQIHHNQNNKELGCGPCRCHGSMFDLQKKGIVILGPATQDLPHYELSLNLELNKIVIGKSSFITPNAEQFPFNLEQLDLFYHLSIALTGFERLETNLSKTYYVRLKNELKDGHNLDKLLLEFKTVKDISKDDLNKYIEEKLYPKFRMLLKEIITTWYFTTVNYGLIGGPTHGTIDSHEYGNGLVWKVMQTEAPGKSTREYGHWSKRPNEK